MALPFPPPSPQGPLRRGGQINNSNALRHGHYSSLAPHPIHAARTHLQLTLGSLRSSRLEQIHTIHENLALFRHVLALTSQTALSAGNTRQLLSQERSFMRTWTKCRRARETLLARLDDLDHLPRLVCHARSLYTWEFKDRGIPTVGLPEEPEFTPLLFATANREASPPLQMYAFGEGVRGVRFLTSSQWTLLAPILASLRQEQAEYAEIARAAHADNSPSPCGAPPTLNAMKGSGAARGSRRMRSETAAHTGNSPSPLGRGDRGVRSETDPYLLDLILLKLAFGLTWNGLPQTLPVRAARSLYRQLYNTGRMAAIYTLLHRHLDREGGRTLEDIADSDALTIQGRLVVPTMSEDLTWEVRTALLLLQRALFNERRRQRLETLERRSRGLYLRDMSLRSVERASGEHRPCPPNDRRSKLPLSPTPLPADDPEPSPPSDLEPETPFGPRVYFETDWNPEPLTFVPLNLGKNDNKWSPNRQSSTLRPRGSQLSDLDSPRTLKPDT